MYIFPGKSVDLRFATVIVVVAGLVFFVVGSLLGWFSHRIYSHRNQVSNPSGTFKSHIDSLPKSQNNLLHQYTEMS
jgi:hypothetical protein